MIELRVLGRTDLRRIDKGRADRIDLPPKRLALLAYLALARPRGLQRRDIVCTVFWPEADQAGARNALNQALHAIRRALGGTGLVSRGREEIGLPPEAFSCDGIGFEERIADGLLREALDLYRGELLRGVHATGAVGFEHWLDGERNRFRRQARDAATRLARAEEQEGNPVGAARWLERGLEIHPTDEMLVRHLIRVLDSAGDRVGALAAYERFASMMHSEYDTSPSPETVALADSVRTPARTNRAEAAGVVVDTRVRAIAVLPLQDVGADAQRAYSVDGMTEALVLELGRIRSLRVISHQSVKRFKGSHLSLREIARMLEVDALVEGSVLEAGGRVRVTAQLVRAEPEQHLWVDAFEADARDVLSVHRDIARSVADAIAIAVSADERQLLDRAREVNPAAYHAYLQGWMRHATLLPLEMAEAIPRYLEAIHLDPTFAPPRANLCVMQFVLLNMGEVPLDTTLPLIRDGAAIAMRLDPALGASHAAQGSVYMAAHAWRNAEKCFREAITLAPSESQNHAALSTVLLATGRYAEANAATEQSRRLDPLAPYANFLSGWSLHYARRPAEAVRQLQRVLDLFADYPLAWIFLAKCHYQLGNRNEAIDACERALEMLPGNPMTLAYVTNMLAGLGEVAGAQRIMQRYEEQREERRHDNPFYRACALCGLDRIAEALDVLEEIRADASATGYLLSVDPLFDRLRDEPRFRNVLERIGLSGGGEPPRSG